MAKREKTPDAWRNRIVGWGEEDPEQLLANPFNFRVHPQEQQDAMLGAITEVGVIQAVVVNKTTGHLVDGHLRVKLAMRAARKSIPVVYVELSEEEERKALAGFDALTGMATIDKQLYAEMIEGLKFTDERFRALVEMNLKGYDEKRKVEFNTGGARCVCPNCGREHSLQEGGV